MRVVKVWARLMDDPRAARRVEALRAEKDAEVVVEGAHESGAARRAAELNADVLEIWTDVDGFMSADPGVIEGAYLVERLSYAEAMELCNFDTKVLYPLTIFPVYQKNIPIHIRNVFAPEGPGTWISSERDVDGKTVKGISSIDDVCLITVRGMGMVGVIGVNYRIFKALSRENISVFFVSQASSESSTSIGVRRGEGARAVEILSEEFLAEIAGGAINEITAGYDLATVQVVGENMRGAAGVAAKLFDTLARSGISVVSCAQGALGLSISFVLPRADLRKALNSLHDAFLMWDYSVLNLFIAGVGTVGSNLLEQIARQQPKFLRENSLQIRVVGIANSRRHIINRSGIELASWREQLELGVEGDYPGAVVATDIFNPVFVDCTAAEALAGEYKALLENNISVVTANKVAASGDYAGYLALKAAARRNGAKFLFETNVGAGLPIIKTIGDLVGSGDRVLKIEAVVSGTLNFIFNEMSAELPLSKTIRKAQEAGYAEPDPRIDLSGKDVMRKLVILSREAGYRLDMNDIDARLFIPDEYFAGSVDDFWTRIPELDSEFENRRAEVAARGKRLRFVATMEASSGGVRAGVALREVDAASPFYNLEGTGNVILLTTERYLDYPMEIKGYGAGAAVTAAGVFADIISIANIR